MHEDQSDPERRLADRPAFQSKAVAECKWNPPPVIDIAGGHFQRIPVAVSGEHFRVFFLKNSVRAECATTLSTSSGEGQMSRR